VQHAGEDEITPPRSLGRYAPAVRLRRALLAHRWRDRQVALRSGKARERIRRCRFSIGSALLTSFTEIRRWPVLKSEGAKPDRT
jgi:hypothetical protein